MKIFTRLCLGLLCYCLMVSNYLQAQEKSTYEIKEIRKNAVTAWANEPSDVRADRPLIGIYANSHPQGVAIDNLVNGGGAVAAGLQPGDVITSIGGNSVKNMHDLEVALSAQEGGRQVVVQYLREGQSRQANVTLKARPVIRADRPLIGIYPADHDGQGIRVDDITAGGGAVEAGIRSGDVITRINNVQISSMGDLQGELSKYKAGEQVQVSYLRGEQLQQARVTLKDRTYNSGNVQRDPCAVFIGVSLNSVGKDGRGVRIGGIIDDTPAKSAGILDGDEILALDDVAVNSFNELLHERNKHQPGEFFTLTILREDRVLEIEAQFKTCDKEEPVTEETIEEVVEEIAAPQDIILDNSLKVEQWRAYPNPAFGTLNVQFQGEAVPTTISLIDTNGRPVYRETLNQFDGYYNQQINLQEVTPGNYYLQVRQGDRFVTEKIVVIPRA